MRYKINEIFYSIQGEGFFTGKPVIFIRFSGCNLQCHFCDTEHKEGVWTTTDEIISELQKYPAKHLVLTGGEPSLQIDEEMLLELRKSGYFIQIETNGTNPLPKGLDWITCSPKEDFILNKGNELKVVSIGQPLDGYLKENFDHFYLQPCSMSNTEEVIECIKNNPRWSLSLQTQKILKIR